jgi:PAP2 superfamily
MYGENVKKASQILSGPLSHWIKIGLMLVPVLADDYITTIHYYILMFG